MLGEAPFGDAHAVQFQRGSGPPSTMCGGGTGRVRGLTCGLGVWLCVEALEGFVSLSCLQSGAAPLPLVAGSFRFSPACAYYACVVDCETCGVPTKNKRFCSRRCAGIRLARERNPHARSPLEIERSKQRRGDGYRDFLNRTYEQMVAGRVTQRTAAEIHEVTQATISRWAAAARADREWERGRRRKLQANGGIPPLDDFAEWRARCFRNERDEPYLTPPFQQAWVDLILDAIEHGERAVILSPPRHGKSQLLIHFCVWQIVKNPNIRVMWVGGNSEIAEQSVAAVADELDNNPNLDVYAGATPFKPASPAGRDWSRSRFTVGTRTVSGIKSPTMVALGKGGKILSRDADLIIFDDIVDHDSTRSPTMRADDKSWLATQLSSRKEEHTALFGIGSRQHHEDLWGDLVENPAYRSIVETAHDPACMLPRHDTVPANHRSCKVCDAHVDCLLWPEVRSMRWLEDQRAAMGNDAEWEMVYLNVARPSGQIMLTREDLARCHDYSRIAGQLPKGEAVRLIAGLDPAMVGNQAAVLYAYDPSTQVRHVVDIDVEPGGGLPGARRVIEDWWRQYRLDMWVVEHANYQAAIMQDRDIIEFCGRHAIGLRPTHTTAKTKFHADFGVGSFIELFKKEMVAIPWGDDATRQRMNALEVELLNFDPEATGRASRKRKTDLVMAAWFPETVIRTWRYSQAAQNGAAVRDSGWRTPYPSRMGDGYRRIA